MESQTFVFVKLDWTMPEPPVKAQYYLPIPKIASVSRMSLIAIDRLQFSEPEQLDHSIASRKLSLPAQDNLHSVFQILQVFFKSLPKPVCLVSHNGDNLDFPILKYEFERILCECDDVAGTFNGVHCVDSAKAIAALMYHVRTRPSLVEVEKASRNLCKENFEPNQPSLASELVDSEWNVRNWDDELVLLTTIASDLYEEERQFRRKEFEFKVNEQYLRSKIGDRDVKKTGNPNWGQNLKERKNVNETTPLRYENDTFQDDAQKQGIQDLGLTAIYFQMFGEFITPCSAEGEAEALSEIVARLGIPILEVFDRQKELLCVKEFQ